MTLRLSVIVPVYNGADLIEPCLDAIRGQAGIDRRDFEIIVVDDGSTDDSAARAEALCDRLVRLETNRGAAAARNAGAAVAGAPLLLFVDADVALEAGALQLLLERFDHSPELSAVVGRYTDIPAAPGLINLYHNFFTVHHHDLSPPEIDWFWGAIGAVKKADFEKAGGFDERYLGASAEDMEFGMALAATGARIAYEPSIRGSHAHHFTFMGMLKNDYFKAVLGTKLRLSGRLPQKAPGFAGWRNLLSISLLLAMNLPLYRLFSLTADLIFGGLVVALLIFINLPHYRALFPRLQPPWDRVKVMVMILHWIQLYVIFVGALAGLLGHLLGRDTYGRPGWI